MLAETIILKISGGPKVDKNGAEIMENLNEHHFKSFNFGRGAGGEGEQTKLLDF